MGLPAQNQPPPGRERPMSPPADHGEDSYVGHERLKDKVAIITGGDSGIGRAIAIAFAREGADLLVTYLEEHADAQETKRWVEAAGRRCVLVSGDISKAQFARGLVQRTLDEFGRLDIVVNNAAFQMSHDSLEEVSDEEWRHTFDVNIHGMFYLTKAALPHLKAGAAILNTSSVNSDKGNAKLIGHSATKAAISNFTASLAQAVAEQGIRVNCVAPGPIWTPLIPSSMPPEKVEKFGDNTAMKRAGQPKEVAPVFVFLASDDASYVTGALYPVTGGTPML